MLGPNSARNVIAYSGFSNSLTTVSGVLAAISAGLNNGTLAWLCSVSARPSQNMPPCGTRLVEAACGAAALFSTLSCWPACTACCWRLAGASLSPEASGPMAKNGWR